MRKLFRRSYILAPLAALVFGACDDSTSPGDTARVQVLLTDAASDYIGEAWVDIGRVELLPADGGDRIVLAEDGTTEEVDLLTLEGLTTELLADVEIPAGDYLELRLIVESARVVLAGDYTFNAGGNEDELTIPSGAQSGIKLKLREEASDDEGSAGVNISGGETVLVVDFDVHQSFRIQGNPETPAGINGVLFTPTLRVIVEDVAGSISGTITVADGLTDVSAEGLVVSAETVDPGDDEEFQSSIATATTDENGDYTIYFLAPGDYTVTVGVEDPLATTPESIDVTIDPSENEVDVDFEVIQP